MAIDFCHITPIPHMSDFVADQSHDLLLAHLVEESEEYTEFYANKDSMKILDNSAFEMYKQGREMYPSDKLIDMGWRVGAKYVVMSDYPSEHYSKTIDAAKELAPTFKDAGFGTFFVPQSEIGDLEGLIASFEWAFNNPDLVDYIGVSILAVPNAYGVEKDNKLQRFLSRWRFMQELEDRGINFKITGDQHIHFLGMVDGPNEIELCKDFKIDTWDSSAAVWAGLNNISFDSSPTGLINGKFEKEVDFSYHTSDIDKHDLVNCNIAVIEGMCK
jgi:hypothetical protein